MSHLHRFSRTELLVGPEGLVAVLAGAFRLRFNVEILDLLPAGQPTVEGLKLYRRGRERAA